MNREDVVKYRITRDGLTGRGKFAHMSLERGILTSLSSHPMSLRKETIKKICETNDYFEPEYFDQIFNGLLEEGYIEETMSMSDIRSAITEARNSELNG